MGLIEKYIGEAIKITKVPKHIMGSEVELKKEKKSDMNILYQLYKEKNESKAGKLKKGKSGFVRQYDLDGKESIELRKFPKYSDAEKYYKKLLRLA
jgi:hypothetical protein